MSINAAILAGGKGERLKDITPYKALVDIDSTSPLKVALYSLANSNFNHGEYVTVVSQDLASYLSAYRPEESYANRIIQPFADGNLKAVLIALDYFSKTQTSHILLINCDDSLCLTPAVITDFLRFSERCIENNSGTVMLTCKGSSGTHKKSWLLNRDGTVRAIRGYHSDLYYYSGICILPTSILQLDSISAGTESKLTHVFDTLITKNKLYGYINKLKPWYPLNTPLEYYQSKNLFLFEP